MRVKLMYVTSNVERQIIGHCSRSNRSCGAKSDLVVQKNQSCFVVEQTTCLLNLYIDLMDEIFMAKAVENLRNYRPCHGKNQNDYNKKSPAVKITYRKNYLQ